MLTHVRIENFKLWQDTGRIRLAPLTVFFGANSSGKSSIQQFLLMLKQTAASPDRSRVIHTGDSGTPVDLGDFSELIHHHDTSRTLRFELSWRQAQELTIEDVLDPARKVTGRDFTFSADVFQEEEGSRQLRVRRMGYQLSSPSAWVGASIVPHARRRRYDLEFENFQGVRNKGRAWPLPGPTRFYGFPDEAVRYFQNTEFLADFSLALEHQLAAINYLGPLRREPERFYVWSGATPEHVGWRGERAVEAILAASDRAYNMKERGALRPLEQIVAQWLKDLDLIEEFELVPIAEGRRHREVRVRVKGSRDTVLITDVGFGISQVLPVLVQCLYADAGSTLIFEQPELHLHPKVQMILADVFIEAALKVRENSRPRGTQVLIESHSEHFLRRLQRRIAEGEVQPEHVALYFCDVVRGQGVLTELDIDLFGDIMNWPSDFFGDQMQDVAAQAKARLRKQVASAPEV